MNAFTLWKPSDVSVTKGKENLAVYRKTPTSDRQFCKTCGGHVLTSHSPWDIVDVYAAILPSLKFEPKLHVSYEEKVVSMRDGLPKFKDMPSDMGGSGATLPD